MVGPTLLAALATITSLSNILTAAHPGERHDANLVARQMEIRTAMAENQFRELNACEGSFDVEARRERAIERRAATVQRLRAERGIDECKQTIYYPTLHSLISNIAVPLLHRRTLQQFETWAQTSHDKTGTGSYSSTSSVATLFGANTTCILTPDNADGPYL